MSTPEPPDWDADWDAELADDVERAGIDPEDTAERDDAEIDLDDIADPLPEDAGQDLPERDVEERIPWQDYDRPTPD